MKREKEKKKQLSLKELEDIELDILTLEQRTKVQQLIKELSERKFKYPILDFKRLPHQQELSDAVAARDDNGVPLYKYILFIGGNGSGKTISSVDIDIRMALGKEGCKKYGLEYIGEARQILVVTKTSDSIKTNLEPYFLGTDSMDDDIKLPKEEIAKGGIKRDGSTQTLKQITLKNGNKIMFRTYDAGAARLEGSSPDFVHLDELPEREDIFIELLRGTRKIKSQMLLSFTPTKFNPAVHDYFYGQKSEEVIRRTFIREVDSLENTHVDHTWLEGLDEEQRKIRRYGMFIPPTGLVYRSFNRERNLVPFISPRELGVGTKYFGALDFGVNHPMAFLLIAVDLDGHVYIFDMIHQKNMLLGELKDGVNSLVRSYGISLEYIVADTSDARARMELDNIGLHTVPADKWSKGENNLSNRRAGIFKINELFEKSTLLISDKCMALVKELEVHAYKGNGSEDVIKLNDDALDALRYFIFGYKPFSETRKYRKRARKRASSVINIQY